MMTATSHVADEVLALLKAIGDPVKAKARLQQISDRDAVADARSDELNRREAELSQGEAAHAVALAELDKRIATVDAAAKRVDDGKAALDAAKAIHAADVARSTQALDDRRLDVANAQIAVTAKADEHARRFKELTQSAIALDAQRAGLEARERALAESEAAFAAKQARLTAAIQEA